MEYFGHLPLPQSESNDQCSSCHVKRRFHSHAKNLFSYEWLCGRLALIEKLLGGVTLNLQLFQLQLKG